MLGKEREKRTSSYDVYVVGEYIRNQMFKASLIKDRRYHLRKYRKCFVGRDTIDWLVKMCHAQSRGEAILAMRCLEEHGVLHHVVDDHVFKDQSLFYRFTRDDDRYLLRKDLAAFYQGLQVFLRVKDSHIQRDYYHRGHLYQGAFYGVDLVDCLVANDDTVARHDVIQQCRELLEYDIIRHVTDDYHFADDRLTYQFHVDYDKPCLLSDVLQASAKASSSAAEHTTPQQDASSTGAVPLSQTGGGGDGPISSDGSSSIDSTTTGNGSVLASSPSPGRHSDGHHFQPSESQQQQHHHQAKPHHHHRHHRHSSGHAAGVSSSGNDVGISDDDDDDSAMSWFGRSAAATAAAAAAKEAELCSGERGVMVKRVVKMQQDEVGYGFVLRGSSPCYVHTIDPLGPAAAAGLKEGQYVLSVNGHNMKNRDHRYVGRQVMDHVGVLTLVVLAQVNARPL